MHEVRPVLTVDEANARLPEIERLVASVREAVARDAARADDLLGGDPRLVFAGAVALLAVDGIVLRDLERGLIDFPACTPDGRHYWLCWIVGEPQVEWWHWPEDGFAGRRPVAEPPT
ncbi:MAG: DUF2203 family protein [Actinobacteria bacterium]|nr:DUF2203 family protein [Actinomycetota bacterium]